MKHIDIYIDFIRKLYVIMKFVFLPLCLIYPWKMLTIGSMLRVLQYVFGKIVCMGCYCSTKKLPSVDSAGGCFDSSCSPLQLFDSHFVSSLVVTDCTRFRAKYPMIYQYRFLPLHKNV